jgi:hypothetical protein
MELVSLVLATVKALCLKLDQSPSSEGVTSKMKGKPPAAFARNFVLRSLRHSMLRRVGESGQISRLNQFMEES